MRWMRLFTTTESVAAGCTLIAIGVLLVTDARVLAAGAPEGGKSIAGSPGKYAVTIAVDERSALRVAQAITGGKVDVVRATGAPPASPSPAPTTSTTVRR